MFPRKVSNRAPRVASRSSSSFSYQRPSASTRVRIDRMSSQLKKGFQDGSPSNIAKTVRSEIGWLGLCLLAACLIGLCYVALWSVSRTEHDDLTRLTHRGGSEHAGHAHSRLEGASDDDVLEHNFGIDPEQWPHGHGNKHAKDHGNAPPLSLRDQQELLKEQLADLKLQQQENEEDRVIADHDIALEKSQSENEKNREEELPPPPPEDDREEWKQEVRMEDMEERRRKRQQARKQQQKERLQEQIQYLAEEEEDGRGGDDKAAMQEGLPDAEEILYEQEEEEQPPPPERRSQRQRRPEAVQEERNHGLGENWERVWSYIKDIDVWNDDSDNAQQSEEEIQIVSAERADAIKKGFIHAWHGYAKHAMGHDEIQPVSDLPGDSWGGLGATLIDALDTIMLMGLTDELVAARNNLEKIDFSIDLQVSFFETTIRHLGGLLGAYEMSIVTGAEDRLYLSKAKQLSDHLLAAFNTPKGIPKSMVNLQSGEIKNYGWTRDRSVLAEVGSNQLEFFTMSHFTLDSKYYSKSKHVLRVLDDMDKPDGLYGRLIETDIAQFPKNERVYTIGGMADSFYEYLLKIWVLTNYEDQDALRMYLDAIDTINEQMLRAFTDDRRRKEPFFFYGEIWYNKFRGRTEELTCFMPGVLALGAYHSILRENQAKSMDFILSPWEQGLVNRRDSHVKLAHALLESCVQLYVEMPTHLAAESIAFDEGGWEVKEPRYQLRPETIESLFLMYSLTGRQVYREWAWAIFEGIEQHCRTEVAYSGVRDVRDIPAEQDNKMESYVMAETFKYLYLLFDDKAASLVPLSRYVFNTEAHPLRRFNVDLKEWDTSSSELRKDTHRYDSPRHPLREDM